MKRLTLSLVAMLIAAYSICQPNAFGKQQATTYYPKDTAYTLEEMISIAQQGSSRAEQLALEKRIAADQYDLFKRTGRPLIAFNGNIPVFNKDNFGVVQPDGSLVFRSRSQSNSDANFSIEQTFPSTKSSISLNTYLNRFDDYYAKSTSYNGTLIYIQLRQPLFTFNQYKWDKRIEPLRFKESQLIAVTASSGFALVICRLFYDVIEAEADLELANSNASFAKRNRAAEDRRRELGSSTDDKVLQLQMMELEALASVEQAQSRLATAKTVILRFAGMQEDQDVKLRVPFSGINPPVSLQEMISAAEKTNPVFLVAKRELMEAQSLTDKAKAEGREVNVIGSFGVTNTGSNVPDLFVNPNDQRRFSIGLQIPIYDGGRRRQKLLIARENEKLISARSRQDIMVLLNEITNLYYEYVFVRTNIGKLNLLDSLGAQRFVISNRLFEVGKITITDLQLSQREKDLARRNYLRVLRRLSELKFGIMEKTGLKIE